MASAPLAAPGIDDQRRDPLVRSDRVDHAPGLTLALQQLVALVELAPAQLSLSLHAFATQAGRAVPSYRGVRVGLVEHGHEVELVAFVEGAGPGSVRSTLRLPLVVLGRDLGWSSTLVLYASVPGAFVDLAADLSHLLGVPLRTPRALDVCPAPLPGADGRGPVHGPVEVAVVVDDDPLPASTASVLRGLEARTSIERAIGLLMSRGDTPERAVERLQQQAAARGEALAQASRAVLGEAAD